MTNIEGAPQTPATSTGLEPNVAGLLSYLVGWITGIVFLVIEKRNKEVRFHAAQSLLFFGGLSVLMIVLSILSSAFLFTAVSTVIWLLYLLVWLGGVAAWITLMVFAYQGKRLSLPIIAPIAERMADKLPQ